MSLLLSRKTRSIYLARFGRKSALLTPPYRLVRLRSAARFSSQIVLKYIDLVRGRYLSFNNVRCASVLSFGSKLHSNLKVSGKSIKCNDLVHGHKFSLRQDSRGLTRLKTLVVLLLCLVALGIVGSNGEKISDWWRLRGYQAPAAVAQLAVQDTMNGYTRHLFYLNKPQLLASVNSFRNNCPENKDTIVLGCYHPGQNGIFIYTVQDPALAGVQQVTAAHEVLHAVYARLSAQDKKYVDGLLQNYYLHDLTNPRVQAEVKLYQQTEPTAVMDEMHSTFGTEIANLPAPLEAYYKRFFTNRSAIVAYEQQYEAAFTTRQSTIASDDQQLTALKQQIGSQEATLSAELNQVNADRSRLDGLLAAGQTDSYNAAVPGFNNEIDVYNRGVASLQNTIASYNQLVVTRNQVAGELTTLTKALDTRLTQQPAR